MKILADINGNILQKYTDVFLQKNPHLDNENLFFFEDEFINSFKIPKLENGVLIETFVEPTPDEIAEANKPIVPEIVSRRQFKIALAILGYNENDILNGIEQLPEHNRTIARISYTESGTFERYSSDLIYVSKTFLGLTDEEIDEVFLTAINY